MIKCISYWSTKHCATYSTSKAPISDALAEAKAAGFAGIELAIGPDTALPPDISQGDCETIRKQIDDAGLICQTLASGMSWGISPTSDDLQVRKQSIQLHADALQRAAWLGCDAMLFVPGVVSAPFVEGVVRYDLAVQRAREAVTQLAEVAERVEVDLCLENVWNGLLYSPIEFASFVDSFRSDRVGIYFDVGNVLGYHQHPPHWIELLGKRIKRVHIKDYKEKFDWSGSYNFCDLLEGDVPWADSMAALRQIGYDKTLVAEMMPWREDMLDVTSSAMDTILAM